MTLTVRYLSFKKEYRIFCSCAGRGERRGEESGRRGEEDEDEEGGIEDSAKGKE